MLAGVLLAVGCSGTPDVAARPVDELFEILDEQTQTVPAEEQLQLQLDEPCALVDRFSLRGVQLELVGSGAARFGDVGRRYQCAFHGRTGSARLEVIRLDDRAAFDEQAALLASREGNEVAQVDGRDVHAVRYEDSGARYLDAELLVPDELGIVHLLVEPTPDRWEQAHVRAVLHRLEQLIDT